MRCRPGEGERDRDVIWGEKVVTVAWERAKKNYSKVGNSRKKLNMPQSCARSGLFIFTSAHVVVDLLAT